MKYIISGNTYHVSDIKYNTQQTGKKLIYELIFSFHDIRESLNFLDFCLKNNLEVYNDNGIVTLLHKINKEIKSIAGKREYMLYNNDDYYKLLHFLESTKQYNEFQNIKEEHKIIITKGLI